MHYLSTRNNQLKESFLNILFRGLSKDGGLFLPSEWPTISLKDLAGKSYQEVAHSIIYPYIQDDISYADLQLIINTAYESFDHKKIAPLLNIDQNKYILELFYGPTFAFKDYALQFLGSLFSYLLNQSKKKITVLGATSGDTGSAAINAFKGKDDIEVFILHPHNNVSEVQRRQMTTVEENNIHNFAIEGNFDDCQNIVKELFVDEEIQSKRQLTSANSINVARWLPQMFYYFLAYRQLVSEGKDIVFSVPSGNFGNICAGMVAKELGLPIKHFIASNNANRTVTDYLETGNYEPKPSVSTISNAMDIGNPSNFVRILELFQNEYGNVKENLNSFSYNDEETKQAMQSVYKETGYVMDPHGAVGYLGLQEHFKTHPDEVGAFLETAHPCKFRETVQEAIGKEIEIPDAIKEVLKKEKKAISIKDYADLKSFLLSEQGI